MESDEKLITLDRCSSREAGTTVRQKMALLS